MGSPRARFGSVVRGGRIYVVGGKRGFRKKDQLRNIEVYDPKTNRDDGDSFSVTVLGPKLILVHGLVKFVPAVAYHFRLNLPAANLPEAF